VFAFIRWALAGLLIAATSLTGCAAVSAPAPKVEPAKSVDQRVIRSETRFSLNLMQSLWAEAPDKNLFISPASVSLALSLTMNGARGATQAAMLKGLALEGVTPETVNQEYGALQTIMANPDPKVEMTIANSIWYKQGSKVNAAFQQVAQQSYRAEVQAADFAKPAAANAINKWVAKATRDRIKTLVDRTQPDDRMYLINAIYFNGKWQNPFPAEETASRNFTLPGGKTKQVSMMADSGRYRYLQGDNFQAVALPYGSGRVNMYVFLPDQKTGLDQFSRSLTQERWDGWLGQLTEREGALVLPKVKLEYATVLNQSLTDLGMGPAFDAAQADFGNLLDGQKTWISRVLHKTFLDINEKGTEAAAATAVGMAGSAAPAKDRFTMIVDRPFLLAIRDDQTGAILFLGAIVDPQPQ
jgi:serpin B